jgi:hypothetical protein
VRRRLRTNLDANFEEGRPHFPQTGVHGRNEQQDAVPPLRACELRRLSKIPADFLAAWRERPRVGEDRFWSEPETNQISPQLQMALDILASVQKEFSIDPIGFSSRGNPWAGWAAKRCCKRSRTTGERRWCFAPSIISRM